MANEKVPDVVDDILASWRPEFPEAAELPAEVTKRVSRLSAMLQAQTEDALASFGLQKAELGVLWTLRREKPPHRLKPNELARELLISSGGTSNVLRRLEASGFIERVADPSDQRSTWVRLTREGVRMAEQSVRVWSTAHRNALAAVSPRTLRQAADALREVLVALGDARPRPRRSRKVG